MPTRILVAIGANLPAPDGASAETTCRRAIEALRGLSALRLVSVSGLYETVPHPPSDQPLYVNAVALLEASEPPDPADLLARLLAIEAIHGRARGAVNAARTLDLDLIAIEAMVRDSPDPILPHPRAHLRGFVLLPLVDVAPDWVHPRLGLTARALLARLPAEPMRLIGQ